MKICPIAKKICQSRFKTFPSDTITKPSNNVTVAQLVKRLLLLHTSQF